MGNYKKKIHLKKNQYFHLKKRVLLSKKLVKKTKNKIKSFDKYLNLKTIELLKYIKNKFKNSEIYFIMGSDNIIKFHRWHKVEKFPKICAKLLYFQEKDI